MASAGTNGYPQQGENTQGYNSTSTQPQTSSTSQSPDQVGWYFVESYYTTLNKTPERLALFYNKRSTFVWGVEGETVPTTIGRQEIAEKIKSLNFKDCKVLVTNVDSQSSAEKGIIIQVMGEMNNDNGATSRKFVQTFFLAEQPNGYFVLNDMLRYLKEDEEEEQFIEEEEVQYQEEPAVEPAQEEPATEEPVQEESQETPVEPEPEIDQEVVAPKAEEPISIAPAVPEIPSAVPAVNGTPVTETEPEPEPEPKVEEPSQPASTSEPLPAPKQEPVVVTPSQPTPVATPPPQPAVKEPPASVPAAPAVKGTWASLLSSKSSAPPPSAQVATPIPVATTTPQTTQAPPATPTSAAASSGWQTAADNSRRHARPQANANSGDSQTQAYVKNVTEAVSPNALKDALSKFGSLKSFEPVRAKNCAFVEFETAAGLQTAKAASPLRIGDVNVLVEERRTSSARLNGPGVYTNSRNPVGGQRGGDQRGGGSQGRGGFQRSDGARYDGRGGTQGSRGGRGGFSQRGRGGAGGSA